MNASQRFLEYAKIWTTSERQQNVCPSALRQFDLAHQLAYELREMGISDVTVDNFCFVYAFLPATPGLEDRPRLGFIAHLDTHPDYPGKDVTPQIIKNYDGSDVPLGASGLRLCRREYPHLPTLAGQTLITTDGRTLLGADGKAGIAEIMAAVQTVIAEGRPHGPLSIAFMADEEIGGGISHLDLKKFGADFAYTVDGWEAGEIVNETFNGIQASVRIRGTAMHAGRGKGILINAQLVAVEFINQLPPDEIPYRTDGREGFFHLLSFRGAVKSARLVYSLRDFSEEGIRHRRELMEQAAQTLNRRYGSGTVTLSFREEYRNMKEKLAQYPQLIEKAADACRLVGLRPKITPVRGGTNGARLSFAGIPCPNLGIGGWAYHGPYEHITAETIDQVAAMLTELIGLFV